MIGLDLQHDPEKCMPVFRKDHASSKIYSAMAINTNPSRSSRLN